MRCSGKRTRFVRPIRKADAFLRVHLIRLVPRHLPLKGKAFGCANSEASPPLGWRSSKIAVMRGIARRSRISFRQEYRVRKEISRRQAYRLREAQQKRYSADAERYACLRKHDMFAFANTICGLTPARFETHPSEKGSSRAFLMIEWQIVKILRTGGCNSTAIAARGESPRRACHGRRS